VIPCVMDMECKDSQALTLLSNPKAVVVRLQRRVTFFVATTTQSFPQDVGWNHIVEDIASAVWWSPQGVSNADSLTRRLEGEIVLPSDLKPSSSISRLTVAVCVGTFALILGVLTFVPILSGSTRS